MSHANYPRPAIATTRPPVPVPILRTSSGGSACSLRHLSSDELCCAPPSFSSPPMRREAVSIRELKPAARAHHGNGTRQSTPGPPPVSGRAQRVGCLGGRRTALGAVEQALGSLHDGVDGVLDGPRPAAAVVSAATVALLLLQARELLLQARELLGVVLRAVRVAVVVLAAEAVLLEEVVA
eukprot:scaffold1486_cov329-Prasinococcus_capsulatus_cf.AAC.4